MSPTQNAILPCPFTFTFASPNPLTSHHRTAIAMAHDYDAKQNCGDDGDEPAQPFFYLPTTHLLDTY